MRFNFKLKQSTQKIELIYKNQNGCEQREGSIK